MEVDISVEAYSPNNSGVLHDSLADDDVISPSDLDQREPGKRLRVAGRARVHPRGSWQLADAWQAVQVIGTDAPQDGSLVLVRADWTGEHLEQAAILNVFCETAHCSEAIRLLDQGVGFGLRKRAQALQLIRHWFDSRDFLEVQTPLRVPSPGVDLHLSAFEASGRFLITSPEYHMKRLLVGGIPRLYQLGSCFRNDELGQLHNSEFTMLEWYRAFRGMEHVISDTENIVNHVATSLSGYPQLTWKGYRVDTTKPFMSMTVAQAFEKACEIDAERVLELADKDESEYFRLLVEQVEPMLQQQKKPVFLTHFPASQGALARRDPRDPRWCERFELYAAGVELCNGFGELTDATEQRERLMNHANQRKKAGLPLYPIDEDFLCALQQGMPPSGGNALGVERLVMLSIGATDIQQLIAFPDGS